MRFLLLISVFFVFCSCRDEVSESKFISHDLHSYWILKTREVIYENEIYIEDLKQVSCDVYNFFNLSENGEKENHFFNNEKDCLEEISIDSWKYDDHEKIITTLSSDGEYEVVYKIIYLNENQLKIQILSEGGDLLEGTGFEVYLILEKKI